MAEYLDEMTLDDCVAFSEDGFEFGINDGHIVSIDRSEQEQ